ncbi:C_GCAxxG_C_C family probable redox protein [Breznakibacter xylanolyticus]|uniref:C_GCAxxG_C_C family probable redox protein n=1 Tax=Breznakibacter xylanolyticus TaxID=990 RepID=A0A2W7MTR9_9BACT|nr:C-GCAxxG-C-C family protein [Breznakibacter xylanolyticus]PZX10933.1 C_GCAxxG_C_C family probable redox protein [Breznakibacter xylanolyticus]
MKKDLAVELFSKGFNCSQSVLAVLGPDLGLPQEQCLKVACAFGAGMARQQLTCGAVTGALMALGLKYGKGEHDDDACKLLTYRKTTDFVTAFMAKHQSIVCRDLLHGLDMNSPVGIDEINRLNLFNSSCPRYVADAVDIALCIVEDELMVF